VNLEYLNSIVAPCLLYVLLGILIVTMSLAMIASSFLVNVIINKFEQLFIEPATHYVFGNSLVVFCNKRNLMECHCLSSLENNFGSQC